MSRDWVFEIGGKTATEKEICEVLPPSDPEFGWTLRNLADLNATGVPLDEACTCCAKMTEHPWLVMLLSILYAAQKSKDSRPEMWLAVYLKRQIAEFEEHVARAPNLTGYFHTFVHLLDYAEGRGEVDTMLYRLGDAMEGQETPRQRLLRGQEELKSLLRYFAMLVDFGLPILPSLRLLRQDPRWYMFKAELDQTCNLIGHGSTLSEAFQNARGRLSDPFVVTMVQAGEKAQALETALARLTR